jgi:uncharacterized protein
MIGNAINDWLLSSLDLFQLMAPYLLLGFFLAGVLHVLVPKEWVARHLGGRGFLASVKAAVVGTPLPLCSCGVIPFAELLKKQGASRSAITSFLISTPQTGVDSFMAAYAMLGLPLALWKVLTAMVSGIIGGTLVPLFDKSDENEADCKTSGPCSSERDISHAGEACCESNKPAVKAAGESCCASSSPAKSSSGSSCCGEAAPTTNVTQKIRSIFVYGLGTLVQDIALWLIIGTLIGGAITAFIPDDLLARTITNSYLQMLLVLVIAVPLYVCATGSIPVAAALVMKGMPIGAAIVFLVAGPATNVATLMVFTKTLGRRTVAVYLGTIIVMSLLFASMFNYFFPDVKLTHLPSGHEHGEGGESLHWWHLATSILLGLLILRIAFNRIRSKLFGASASTGTDGTAPLGSLILSVDGMSCGHCQGVVKKALEAVCGVQNVTVSLDDGQAVITGTELTNPPLITAVAKAGYKATILH